jgi:putative exporter of polyketide antibiotics
MRGRPTVDLVVLALTVTVCTVLIMLTVAVTVAGIIPPNEPLPGRYLDVLVAASATMLGALLGLLGGRKGLPTESGPRSVDK